MASKVPNGDDIEQNAEFLRALEEQHGKRLSSEQARAVFKRHGIEVVEQNSEQWYPIPKNAPLDLIEARKILVRHNVNDSARTKCNMFIENTVRGRVNGGKGSGIPEEDKKELKEQDLLLTEKNPKMGKRSRARFLAKHLCQYSGKAWTAEAIRKII